MYKAMYDRQKNGKWHRRRSVDNVMKELEQARAKYPFSYIQFWDEIFVDNEEWLEEFAERYSKSIGVPFWCYVYARFITPKCIELLEKAGCHTVNMGVQSIRKETRKIIRRGDSNDKIIEAIRLIGDSKIYLETGNILQLPGQSLDEVFEMVDFYNEQKVDRPVAGFLRYYPRTDIVATGLQMGMITQEDVDRFEEGEETTPFVVASGRDSWTQQKVATLLYLTPYAPVWVVRSLVKSKLWRFVPSGTLAIVFFSWLGWIRSVRTGKWRHPEVFSAGRYIQLMVSYGFKKLGWKLRKWRTPPGGPEYRRLPQTSGDAS
jgi:hypothetical protein